APDVDVKQICGNISDAEKQVNANVFHYFCTGSRRHKIPRIQQWNLRAPQDVELNVWDHPTTQAAEGEMVFEIEITESMCNVYGTMHGGCVAFLLDPTTVASVVLVGHAKGFDGTGVSTSMNVR
ncbi:hypothetical protein B0H14DRAFT_2407665, partial [Mycena olivaceomarginata]